jgi:hypothetical protein
MHSYAVIKAAFESGEEVPLENMLFLMRHFKRKALNLSEQGELQEAEAALKESGMWAQACAPYMHPRLNSIDSRTTMEAGDTLQQLLRAIDGTTIGIADGAASEPALEVEPSLSLQ